MEYEGASIYEQENFLTNYLQRRNRKDSPNNAIEEPIIFEMLGDICDKKILDLGCGDGSFGIELLKRGAVSYTGVEASEKMVKLAVQQADSEKAIFIHDTMENYGYPEREFDIAISRLAVHYVENIEFLFENICRAIKPGGRFIFSVQHPITTSSFESKKTGDKRGSWLVDDYFNEEKRSEPWIGEVVVKYHRTVESYFKALTAAGFSITALKEGKPLREHFSSQEEYERRKRIPVFLVFSCSKL